MPMIGTTISHYKITEKLGEGGMGVVYKAEDTKLKRTVALKFLAAHLLNDEETKARFQREAEAAAALSHSNIAVIYDIDESDGHSFIAMEFVDGPCVSEKIAERPLKLEEALKIAIEAAQGLQAAHERGVVHRDIKSANLMVTPQGQVKIMDFGLAQLAERSKLTETTTILGTPSYMSPEQAVGDKTDRRTDLWSLGVVLYEMVASRLPFAGERHEAVLYGITNEDPEPVTALRAGLPMELEWIIGKALAKDREERYQHVEDLLVDLRSLKKKLEAGKSTILRAGVATGTSAGPTQPPGQAEDPSARHPLVKYHVIENLEEQDEAVAYRAEDTELHRSVAIRIVPESAAQKLERRQRLKRATLTAVTAMIALVVGAVATVQFRGPSASQEMPVRRFSFAPEHLTYALGSLAQAVISPSGKHIAYVAGVGDPMLWIRDLDREEPREIEGTEGAQLPCWSPDSEFILFAARGEVKRISAQRGAATTICELPQSSYFGGSLSPDGNSFVFAAGAPYRLYEVPARGGNPRLLAELDWSGKGPSIVLPHFLPSSSGGRTLIYSKGSAGGLEMFVWNLETGEPRVLGDGFFPIYSPTGHIVYVVEPDLWALPFSLETLSPTGEAFPIAQDGREPSISDDGTLIYTDVTRGRQGLVWLDRQGKNLGAIGQPQREILGLDLSPDGRRVVVHSLEDGNIDVWVHEVDRPLRQRVTFHSGLDGRAIWGPSENEVTFHSTREGYYDIYTRPLEGTGEPELLVGTPLSQRPLDWSPDGKHLLYTVRDPENGPDLWYLERKQDSSGFDSMPFLQTPFSERAPRFSPDGRFVVYQSDKSGRNEIYVRTFPDGENDWPVSTNGGVRPRWSHSGEELFYVEGDTLVAAPVSTKPTFTTGATTSLFQHASFGSPGPGYDVSADGRRFVVVETLEPVEADPPSIRVVQNWFAEFKDRQLQP